MIIFIHNMMFKFLIIIVFSLQFIGFYNFLFIVKGQEYFNLLFRLIHFTIGRYLLSVSNNYFMILRLGLVC
jgi:hypothetical protein